MGGFLSRFVQGVKVTALSWRAASMSTWDWLIKPLGEGEMGKMSVDSSKKDDRGAGGRVAPEVRRLVVSVASSVAMLSLGVVWLAVGGLGSWSPGRSLLAVVFLFLFLQILDAAVAGPLVAATRATVVDLVEVSLLERGACIGAAVEARL